MSATDELRRLLDERGVEWRRAPHYSSKSVDNETIFAGNGIEWYAREYDGDYVELRTLRLLVTPSRAVDATVGRETCRNVLGEGDFVCSECGAFVHARNANVGKSHVDEDGVRWYGTSYEHNFNYCPNCGARIEAGG